MIDRIMVAVIAAMSILMMLLGVCVIILFSFSAFLWVGIQIGFPYTMILFAGIGLAFAMYEGDGSG